MLILFLSLLEIKDMSFDEVSLKELIISSSKSSNLIKLKNLSSLIKKALPYTNHIQIACPPGRNEPYEGEINYPYLFNIIENYNYNGYIGCEYKPLKNTLDSLKWAKSFGINII